MKKKLPLYVSILSIIISFGLVSQAQTLSTVGKSKISLKEFKEKYKEVREKSFVNVPSEKEFLQELVRYEIGVQEAKRLNLQKDPIVVERMNQLLYQFLLEKQLGESISKIKVTESDMKSYYRSNPELRTSHILIEIPPNANSAQKAAARKRANDIYAEVKKSKKSFEELVNLYTDDSITKRSGGDVGWHTRLTITPEYYNAAKKMKLNQIFGLVETIYGYHIIKLTGKNTYQKANKRQLRQIVFEIKRKEIFDRYFANLRKKYPVKINDKLLK